MANKILLGGLSAILLVAVVVGVVAGIARFPHKIGNSFSAPTNDDASADRLSSSSKAISAICAPTDYKDVCVRTLSGMSNGTASTEDLIKYAVHAIIDEVTASSSKPSELRKAIDDPMNKEALAGCEQMFDLAADGLRAVVARAGNPKEMSQNVDDINTWLSSVITYQKTCLDELTLPEAKSALEGSVQNITMLTSNAISIINEIAKLFGVLPLKGLGLPETGRKLLEANGSRYPEWFSASDRRLLAAHGSGGAPPNAVVAKDGSGDYKTISQAVAAIPSNYKGGRWVIYVKAGVYKENVILDKDKVNVFMYGDGARKTVVTGSKNFIDGTPTSATATFIVYGKGFIAKAMGFSNTAGAAKHQAVALRVCSDMSAFFNCRMDGYQDTLYVHSQRQFYRNCVVSGTIDFIFGDARAVLQNCLLVVRRPMDNQQNIVTAQGKAERAETTGIVIHNSRIVPDRRLFPDRFKIKTYLARPWKQYSTAVFLENTIGDLITPEGYLMWQGEDYSSTLYYAEYANRGPGAATAQRVRWPGVHVLKSKAEAMKWTVGSFIQGNTWIKYTGAPYIVGLKN